MRPALIARKFTVVGLGEVLWDLLPLGKQLGGASANFAYHAQTLGAEALLISRVGNDTLGHELLDRLRSLRMRTDGITIDSAAPTGTVSVELTAAGQPKFAIRENVAWDRLVVSDFARGMVAQADAVCFGSLAQRGEISRTAIRSLLNQSRPDALRIFDVNLRQNFFSVAVITASLQLANVLKISDEELPVLARLLELNGAPAEQLAELAHRFDLRLVALTCGARGSLFYSGGQFSEVAGLPVRVADTIGAGDSFTAMLTMGLLLGWDLERINRRANEVAAFVVSQPGATPELPFHLRLSAAARSLRVLIFIILAGWMVGKTAAQATTELYRITDGVTHTTMNFHQVVVPKGGEQVLAELKGPGKVTFFYITDDTVGRWYPGLLLKVFWDEEKFPSIEVPLSDFFGAIAGKEVDYQSAPMQINHSCFTSYLPMPFSKHARFVLVNDGDRDYSQKVAYGVDFEQSPTYAKEQSRLHCEWRRSNPVTNGLHTIMEAQGRGQYVGGFLQVTSKVPNIWFGEGDTIFHLDGQSFGHTPGTEDEYGSCWEDPHWRTFSSAYCGHVLNENNVNRMYRWYMANPVRFQKSLKVEIQNQHNNGTPTAGDADEYTSVAFWYQQGAHRVRLLPTFKERIAGSLIREK